MPKVIARIFDPRNEEVFTHFGLTTVCPTNLTVDAVYSALIESHAIKQITFGASTVSFISHTVTKEYLGLRVQDVIPSPGEMLYGIRHANQTLTLANDKDYVLLDSDMLIFTRIID